jgi:hypothetical protein
MAQLQISAFVSEKTSQQLEEFTQAHGVKKAHVIEQALLHHLHALRELPADLIIPARIVVEEPSAQRVSKLVSSPRKPTAPLRKLLSKA